MTTQYTPILKLALPVTGELSGSWGDVVNDNITSMVEQAIAGLATINTWSTNSHTLTTANGVSSESRCAMLVAETGSGGTAITGAGTIVCPGEPKLYVLQNNTSFTVTLNTAAGTGTAVAAGNTAFLFCDGTDVNPCVTTIVDGKVTGNLTVDGNATINGNTTLGDAATDTITATARFNTDLLPSTDNARDLGSAANAWKDLYIDGTATIATLNVTTIDTTNLEVTNIKAKDGTASITIADSTGAVSFANNVTLGDATTDTVTVNGYMGVGGAPNGAFGLYVRGTAQSGTTQYGVYSTFTGSSAGTNQLASFVSSLTVPDVAYTVGSVYGVRTVNVTKGASATITSQYGVYIDDQTQGTNNYGITSLVSSGTNKWNIYASGTAANYFAGNVLVGDTTSTTSPLSAGSFITASSTTGSELILKNSSGIVTGELVGGVAFGNDDPTSGTPPHYSGIQARSIDSSGTMTLGFYTGLANYEANTPQVLIDSSGNVGIGTSSPLALLNTYQVNGGGDANILFQNFSTTTSTAVALYLSPTNGSLTTGSIRSAFIKGINVGGGVTALTFGTNSSGADPTEKMRLDSSGNMGLGVTPSGWASNYRALDFNHGALSQGGTGAGSVIDLNYNCYFNGTNWIYKNSDEASQYRQAGGLHYWYNAPSGTAGNTITFTQAMTLDASGNLGIGSTSLTGRRLVLSGTVTGSTTSYGMYGAVTFQSDVTTHAYGIRSQSGTQAASFTLPLLSHYAASQGTFGAASTVTTQYGFNADSSLTGATNNYGFYGNIAAATGRYNFYANGTADNYFAGNVLQGYTAPLSFTGPAGTITPTIQAVAPTGSLTQGIASTTHVTSGNGPNFVFGKSRGASASAPTIVSSGDASGSIVFTAYDGAAYLPTAYIQSAVDGTPGTNDMPGRLVFFTTADGASSPTERMRITNAGNVGIGTSSPNTNLEISTSVDPILRLNNSTNAVTTGADIGEIQFYTNDASINGTGIKSFIKTVAAAFGAAQGGADLVFGTAAYGVGDASEKMRLDKDGNMGLGVTPSAWGTSFKAMQLGAGGYISGRTNTDEVYVGANAYYDTTDNRWEYIATDVATQYYQDAGTHVWRYAGSGTAGAAITFTQAMTLDTSGRLLVGLTSSNAAFNGKLQVEGTTDAYSSLVRYSSTAAGGPVYYFGRSKSATLGTNTIVASGDTLGSIAFSGANGTGYSDAAYIQAFVDGTPGASADMPGRLVFSTSADGSATPTERMRIDSSGNVGIGNTAPASVLDIQRSTATTNATDGIFIMRTGCSGTAAAGLGSYINFLTENSNGTQYETAYIGAATESSTAADKDGYIFFSTALNSSNPTERMRINSSGDLLVNATSAVSGEKLFVTTNAAQNIIGARLGASGSNATCFLAGNATGATSFDYFGAYNGSGTKMAGITSAGTFQSATNTYGGTSDERLKENITDATPKLNDLLSVRIRNFNFKSDEQKLKQIGVIAQELETVFPALVEDTPTWNEQGESTGTVKNVKYSVFVPMLIKAMQEQQAIITALTARVAALESN